MSEPKKVYVECGPGWACLYRPLIDLCELYGVKVLQVKEKFGLFRMYVSASPEGKPDLYKLINAAEAASSHICEECGESGVTTTIKARLSTKPNAAVSSGSKPSATPAARSVTPERG